MSDPICPACGKTNPPGTPKCQCGRVLPPPTVGPTPPTIGPASAPDAMIPKTVIRKIEPPKPSQPGPQGPATGNSLPVAGRSEQHFAPNPTPLPNMRPPTDPPRTVPGAGRWLPGGPVYFIKSVLSLLFLVLLIGGGAITYLNNKNSARPEVVVAGMAKQYLDALSKQDFVTAYAMFSTAAQAQSSMDEFRQLRDTTPWTWSNISVASIEPDAVVIQYDLALQDRPTQKDYLLFVKEGERWVRPYTWGLLKKTEAAFDKGDADMAALLSQAAVTVDPRDPMARGYLCEAFYYRKLPDQARKECELTLQLIEKYPSKLSLKSLYHLHAILGDTYKNAVKNYPRAIDEYTLMLKFPALSNEDQCELLLARADSLTQLSRGQEAFADLGRAASFCAKPEDQQFIQRRQAELSQFLQQQQQQAPPQTPTQAPQAQPR